MLPWLGTGFGDYGRGQCDIQFEPRSSKGWTSQCVLHVKPDVREFGECGCGCGPCVVHIHYAQGGATKLPESLRNRERCLAVTESKKNVVFFI